MVAILEAPRATLDDEHLAWWPQKLGVDQLLQRGSKSRRVTNTSTPGAMAAWRGARRSGRFCDSMG